MDGAREISNIEMKTGIAKQKEADKKAKRQRRKKKVKR
jgi:hypothetical protein